VSALCVSVLLKEELLRFCFKEVMLSYLAFFLKKKYVVMLLNFYLVLFVIVVSLVMLKILSRLVFC
jgi:hypothetical protein